MTVSLTTSPPLAPPSSDVAVQVALSAGNFARIWCTAAPAGSAIEQLIREAGGRVEVHSSGAGSFSFDGSIPGGYVFACQEILRTSSAGSAGYQGAPGAAHSEQVVGTSAPDGLQVVAVHIGTRLTVDVGIGDDRAVLTLWVWGDTIRATTLHEHGEATPSLTPRASASDVMRSAIATADVREQLEELDGMAVSTALGDMDAIAVGVLAAYAAHIADAGVHANADNQNHIPPAYQGFGDAQEWFRAVAEMYRRHALNNPETGAHRGSQDYHEVGGILRPDLANLPIVTQPSSTADAMFGVADLWESYERHRVSASHTAPDTTHTLPALPPLLELYRRISAGLRDASSAPSPTVNEGAVLLKHGLGMGDQ